MKIKFFAIMLLTSFVISNAQWTEFRGPNRSGDTNAANLPIEFKKEAAQWRTEIHDNGWSSPVILNGQIWLTTATKKGDSLFAVCVDAESGKILHDILVFAPSKEQRIHGLNSYATPTPVLESEFVYVHFGTFGTACLNTTSGKIVWSRTDMKCEHMQGPASSPVIYKNLLILHLEGIEHPSIFALDKKTGKTVWQVERPRELYDDSKPVYRKAYSTPIIITVNGKDQLISNGAKICQAFDPLTGKEIWRVVYGGDSTVTSCLFEQGLVLVNCGLNYVDGKELVGMWAVDPGGIGDVTETHVRWKREGDTPGIPTPLAKDGLCYMVSDKGTAVCLDVKSGEEYWKHEFKTKFMASPIYSEGKIYLFAMNGKIIVLQDGKALKVLAESKLDRIQATPAPYKQSLIVRTDDSLYRF